MAINSIVFSILALALTTACYGMDNGLRKQVFASWKLSDSSFELICKNVYCFDESSEAVGVKNWFAESLQKVPLFLQSNIYSIGYIQWVEHEKPNYIKGRVQSKDNSIWLETSKDINLDEVLVHEFTHVFDKYNREITIKYLNLRFNKTYYQEKISNLIKYLEGDVNKNSESGIYTNMALQQMIQDIKFPQRQNSDFHAFNSGEYFAVSIELYYKYKKTNRLDLLSNYLIKDEIEFIKKIFN
jgi:hypothetical protein